MRIFVLLIMWLIVIVLLSYFCFITKYGDDMSNIKSVDVMTDGNIDINSTDNSTINILKSSDLVEEINISIKPREDDNLTENIDNIDEEINLISTPTPTVSTPIPMPTPVETKILETETIEENLTVTEEEVEIKSTIQEQEENQTKEVKVDKSLMCEDIFNSLLSKDKIYFDKNRFDIKEDSHTLLDKIITVSKECPDSKIVIEGYTDSYGSQRGNIKISQKRANAVKNYLIKGGISKERLKAIGYGEIKPIASNRTAKGREKNRRIEIHIEGVKSE